MFFTKFLERDVFPDIAVELKLDTTFDQLSVALIDNIFFQFKARNSVG